MTGRTKKLDSDARRAALSSVLKTKNKGQVSKPQKAGNLAAVLPKVEPADFSSLPGFREQSLQKMAAELLQIDVPFFRSHDGQACATTTINGRPFINYSSYDYLGINGHPKIAEAAKSAIDRYGVSAGASRVVGGERPVHRELEEKLAWLYGVEDALVFVSGHATNVSTIGTLVGKNDVILHDSFIHNSILTGATLSGASRQSFPHNDLEALESLLIRRRGSQGVTLVIVEGVYSMDGDCSQLDRIIELKRQYGFWLMVDEAHSLGILGKTGRGLAEFHNVDPKDVDIWMGTCSKTLAGCGGYIAGSKDLIEYLKVSASGFVFSVGMPPLIASSLSTAIDIMVDEKDRVERVQQNGASLLSKAKDGGFDTGTSEGHAVVPIMIGDSIKATVIAGRLAEKGVNVSPIIHPAVPERSSRLRFFVTSEHTDEQFDDTIEALQEVSEDYDNDPITLKQLASLADE